MIFINELAEVGQVSLALEPSFFHSLLEADRGRSQRDGVPTINIKNVQDNSGKAGDFVGVANTCYDVRNQQ